MAKKRWLGIAMITLWFGSIGGGSWVLQRYGLAHRPNDFEQIAIFRMGLEIAEFETHCLGVRPHWHEWHQSQHYVTILFFTPPQTCEELQILMERAHPAVDGRPPKTL